MDKTKATIGALLHDIGKLIQRATGERKIHSVIGAEYLKGLGVTDADVLACVMYHHASEISAARDISDYAYITYIADNIASGTERKKSGIDETGWDAKTPLASVFNLLNTETQQARYYKPGTLDDNSGLCIPTPSRPAFDQYIYAKIQEDFTNALRGFDLTEGFISALLDTAEAVLTFVPSSTDKSEIPDISLYDHLKLTAALAACIAGYLPEGTDYRKTLFDNAEGFYGEPFMRVLSADMSGIQDFIYTIHSAGALKMLRARSFYLELFTENIIDEILAKTGLTRANLLYSGGGHFYLLLPNTPDVLAVADSVFSDINAWLLKRFGAALYIAYASVPASAYQLGMDRKKDKEQAQKNDYTAIWSELSKQTAAKKMNRYTAADIKRLNNTHKTGRECRVCKQIGENDICPLCEALTRMSSRILKTYANDEENVFFVISGDKEGLPLAPGRYASAYTETELKEALDKGGDIVRYYGKNAFYAGDKLGTRLWVGDYCFDKEISNYAKYAEGIDRIGVLRMDADNLGKAFSSGFAHTGGKYNTLSRYAAFSRLLSMFFKRYINLILHGKNKKAKITIIYAGGDDMFLIGAWDDIISAAQEIRERFGEYTQDKLTLSAGLSLYPGKYPIHVMARETGELEDCAKGCNNGMKDAVCLFMPDLCFTWAELKQVTEKRDTFAALLGSDIEKGSGFLYKLLQYINGVEKEEASGEAKLSLARFAYLVSRAEPDTDDIAAKEAFRSFSRNLYEQIQDKHGRKSLKAAILLYVYANRKRSDENDN